MSARLSVRNGVGETSISVQLFKIRVGVKNPLIYEHLFFTYQVRWSCRIRCNFRQLRFNLSKSTLFKRQEDICISFSCIISICFLSLHLEVNQSIQADRPIFGMSVYNVQEKYNIL